MKAPVNIRIDHFFKEIANELNIPVEDVTSVYRHYRKHVEEEFKTKAIIELYKFGKFFASPKWIVKDWTTLTKRVIYPELLNQEQDPEVLKVNLDCIKRLEEKLEKISQYEKFGFAKKYFEKSTANIRRDIEENLERRLCRSNSEAEINDLQQLPRELGSSETDGI